MDTLLIYTVVAVLQIIFSVGKVLDVKWSYDDNLVPLMVLNVILSAAWILSTAWGIEGVMDGDYVMIFVYIASSAVGKYIAIKFFRK